MTDHALFDLLVLDLSQYISGPYCTKLLADFGAEVMKIEKPGAGDVARRSGPFLNDRPDPEKSGLFLFLNTNKKSITLNLDTELGSKIFKELVKRADVVVENFEPGIMAQWGLDYSSLEKINPGLVMTSITYFGQDGPYRDYKAVDMTAFALGGYMHITGEPDQGPVKAGGFQSEFQAGLNGAIGTLVALNHRDATGVGQYLDVSATEAVTFVLGGLFPPQYITGRTEGRVGNRISTPDDASYPSTTLPCKDGYVHVHGKHGEPEVLANLMNEPRILAPELLEKPRGHADDIDVLMLPWLIEHVKAEIVAQAQKSRLPFTQVLDIDEVVQDPHHASRGYFVDIEHPKAGKLRYPGAPFKMSQTPWRAGRAPLLGEHNEEIYCQRLGFSKEDLVKLREMKAI